MKPPDRISTNGSTASGPQNGNNKEVSSEAEDVEVQCPTNSHEGKQMIDIVLPFSVDHVYSLIFTDSQWLQDFMSSRDTKDFVPSEWQYCSETGEKVRQMTYIIALNLAIAKSARSTESQKIIVGKEGEAYVIETDVSNQGVPYSESFSIKSHNCITKISKQQCRYRVFSSINYKKSVWGLVKTIIEKNAMQGAVDFCNDLEKALKELSGKAPINHQPTEVRQTQSLVHVDQSSNPPILTIETQSKVKTTPLPPKPSTNVSSTSTQESKARYTSAEFIVKAMVVLLSLLLLVNMLIALKLGSLEDLSIKLNSFPDQLLSDTPAEKVPTLSRGEFLRILRKQEILHRTEISKWQEALGDMLKLFHMMETSLLDLKTTIDSHSSSATIKSMTDNLHSSRYSAPEKNKNTYK